MRLVSGSDSQARVGSFIFEGVDVEALLTDDGQWHVRSGGCEAMERHLGAATRILFNPSNHASTRSLIDEILAWQREGADEQSPSRPGEEWMTTDRRRVTGT
jgi:hypothetical protein